MNQLVRTRPKAANRTMVPAIWHLSLVRHAQAQLVSPGQGDRNRSLELRGQRDAAEMGRRLVQRGILPPGILASPAARALQTARIIAAEFGLEEHAIRLCEGLYLASAQQLLHVARTLGGDAGHLMIIGHNPGISEFVRRLSGQQHIGNLPTCAVYMLHFELRNWRELAWASGRLFGFDHP